MQRRGRSGMKGNTLVTTLCGCLAVAALGATLYMGSLNRFLQRHHDDMAGTIKDLSLRRAGCEAALADMAKFEKHLDTFLADKDREIKHLGAQIAATRRRIGKVNEIKEEYEKFEQELEAIKKILSLIAGQSEGGR